MQEKYAEQKKDNKCSARTSTNSLFFQTDLLKGKWVEILKKPLYDSQHGFQEKRPVFTALAVYDNMFRR